MAAPVFVSYARKDQDRVFPLVERLESAGVSVWIDRRGIDAAFAWREEIVDAIDGCVVLALMVSGHSMASEQIVTEVTLAKDAKKAILPLLLEPVEIPKALRWHLAGIQHIDLSHSGWLDEVLRSFARLGIQAQAAAGETSLPSVLTNLPRPLTRFIGREREQEEIRRHLADACLLTLTGTGGIGKTRLALQVGGDLLEEYGDGVFLVELEGVPGPELVPQAVASVLGLREEPGRPLLATLSTFVGSKHLLLLLDNCEHLVDGCARLADTLLRACPRLRILATSRQALGVPGEIVWRVPPLSLPDPASLPPDQAGLPEVLMQCEAVRLFMDRAVSSQPRFELTKENAPTVAHICHRRLEGIPLAIELAAARVRLLSVQEIAERLDDRFRLLSGGSRTLPRRQQTLRAAIDWSYDLLTELERALFRRLAVFAGGFTLEAVEAVCGDCGIRIADCGLPTNDERSMTNAASPQIRNPQSAIRNEEVLDLLEQLIDKSLVMVGEHRGETRYRLLDSIQSYGEERLVESGEGELLRARHRDWCLALAESAEPELEGADQAEWLDRLDTENANLRAALAWCVAEGRRQKAEGRREGAAAEDVNAHEALLPTAYCLLPTDPEVGLRLAGALWRFWEMRGYLTEGRERLAELLSIADCGSLARAKALHGAGALAHDQSDYAAARAFYEESLHLRRSLGDRRGIASTLNNLGLVACEEGDITTARSLFDESLAIERELGNTAGIAASLHNLGIVACEQGDYVTARSLYNESLTIERQRGNQEGIACSLATLANVAFHQGEYQAARALHEESLAILRELGDKRGVGLSLLNLAVVARRQGDGAAAYVLYAESLEIQQELGDRRGIAICLEGLAGLAVPRPEDAPQADATRENARRAARLFGAAEALREAIHSPIPAAWRAEHEASVAALRAALGGETFAEAWTAGRAAPLPEVIQEAKGTSETGSNDGDERRPSS